VSSLAALARDVGVPILAHPSLAGAARIAPPLLLGKLFRLFGADATIFPNAGGRFGYSRETCAAIVRAARDPWSNLRPALPVPAGGMSVERVPAMRSTFGDDAMLLIGGDLLAAGNALESRCRAFVAACANPRRSHERNGPVRRFVPPRPARSRPTRARHSAGNRSTCSRTSPMPPRRSATSRARRCSSATTSPASCATSRSRRAATRRSSATRTCTPC
jgi:hypothetical protein